MMTVGELLTVLKDVEPSAWVIVFGSGPAIRIITELGANEPFVRIEGKP